MSNFNYVRTASNGYGSTGIFSSNNVGDVLVLGFVGFGDFRTPPFPSTMTDSAGNVYTLLCTGSYFTYTQICLDALYVCPSCVASSGDNSFVMPTTASVGNWAMGVEYTSAGALSLDSWSGVESLSTPVSVSPTTIGDLAIGIGLNVSGTWTPDPSTTARYNLSFGLIWQDAIVESSGSYTQTFTTVGGVGNSGFVALIKGTSFNSSYQPVVHVNIGTALPLGE